MIDIEAEGLMPLSKFVLEKNREQQISEYLYGRSIEQPMEVQEPVSYTHLKTTGGMRLQIL